MLTAVLVVGALMGFALMFARIAARFNPDEDPWLEEGSLK